MSSYIIGDLQGCYSPFLRLLDTIKFNPKQDTVWLAGDLINRGCDSLSTLRYIVQHNQSFKCVLGNHDTHMLACFYSHHAPFVSDTFADITMAPDAFKLLEWLRNQPICHYFSKYNVFLSHAGLYPFWTVSQALAYAKEVEQHLQMKNTADFGQFIQVIYGNTPYQWSPTLTNNDRLRFIVNAFTRMRAVSPDGTLDLHHKGDLKDIKKPLLPWFNHSKSHPSSAHIAFGHWASLEGHIEEHTNQPFNLFALDTGCVWGGQLTALCLDNFKTYSVEQ